MTEREFYISLISVYSNELKKYLELLNKHYPIIVPKNNKSVLRAKELFETTENKVKLLSSFLQVEEEAKEYCEEISSCYSDFARIVLDAKPEDRNDIFIDTIQFFKQLEERYNNK
jgi:DNA-directed RNA polymerase subunit F